MGLCGTLGGERGPRVGTPTDDPAEMTNTEIAEKLRISVRTIEGHRAKIIKKLEVKNTAGLIRFSIESGLLD